jgi:hypothetical protein
MRKLFLMALLPVLFIACGPKIYKSNEFSSVASTHKTVAIIPAIVSIQLRPNQAKKITAEEIKNNEQSTGYSIQDKMYSWLLRRNDKMNFTVTFQDVNKTNSLLKKANIQYADLQGTSKKDLADLLGVDAVISTNVNMEKPMSEGASIAVGALTGFWGSTNAATITIDIHEHINGDLIWKYDYNASGSAFSSASQLVDGLMRNASKKFPYRQD